MSECKFCRGGYFDTFSPYYAGQDVECVNGVLIDIDEAHEGGASDVEHPLAPCHPNYKTQEPNDSIERLEAWRSIQEQPLTESEQAKIDEVWEIHKAAKPEETGSYGSPEGVQSWHSYGLHGEN